MWRVIKHFSSQKGQQRKFINFPLKFVRLSFSPTFSSQCLYIIETELLLLFVWFGKLSRNKVTKLFAAVVVFFYSIFSFIMGDLFFLFLSMSNARRLNSCHSKTILELWPWVASILPWFASLTDIFSYPNTVVNVVVPICILDAPYHMHYWLFLESEGGSLLLSLLFSSYILCKFCLFSSHLG